MVHFTKRILAMLLAVIMVVGLLPVTVLHVHAAGSVVLSGGDAEGYAGETVEVEVWLDSNPGMAYLEVRLIYDNENLELKKAVLGDLELDFYTSGKLTKPGMTWGTEDGYNSSETGLAATLTFKIKDNAAPGVYSISFEYRDACDEAFNTLETVLKDGSITVTCTHPTTETHPKQAPNCRDVGYTEGVWCTVCSSYIEGHEEIPTTDDHSYGNYISISDNQHQRVCDLCQNHETTDHKWDDGEVTMNPSHAMQGEMTYTCALCQATRTETVDIIPHTFDQQNTEEQYLVSSATCTAKAVYYYSCECGAKGDKTFESGETLPHEYTQQVVKPESLFKEADCANRAMYYYSCECGAVDQNYDRYFEYGEMLPHTYDKQVATDAYLASKATCTAKATYYYSCVCGRSGTETFEHGETLPHTYDREVVEEKYFAMGADCQNPAKYYKSCACGAKGTATFDVGEPADHNYQQQVATDKYLATGATCTEKATYYYSCSCGAKGDKTFESGETLPHTHDQKVATDKYLATKATCTKKATYYYSCACGAKGDKTFESGEMLPHTHDQKVATDKYLATKATCTEKATYYYSCSCGAKGTETFESGETLPHTHDQKVATDKYLATKASCTAKATYYYSCSCGVKGDKTFESGEMLPHTAEKQIVTDKYLKSKATCTAKAVYYYACTECDTKCDKTYEHGDALGHEFNTEKWTSDGFAHWHQCIRCTERQDEDIHTLGPEATEETPQICIVCERIIRPAIGHDHTFGAALSYDSWYHWSECTDCGDKVDMIKHSFDNDCDERCDECGYVREITHDFGTKWTATADGHAHTCVICGKNDQLVPHTPGPEATEDSAQLCTVCGYVIKDKLVHTHSYASAWETNGDKHWHECECGAKANEAAHAYDNACDTDCNVCGAIRSTYHDFSGAWKSDKNEHWQVCTVCGTKGYVAAHTPGMEATEDNAQTCMTCDYVIKEKLPHTHAFGEWQHTDDDKHVRACACGEQESDACAYGMPTVTEPTYQDAGLQISECSVCGGKKTVILEKLPSKDEVASADTTVYVKVETGSDAILDINVELVVEKITETVAQTVLDKIEQLDAAAEVLQSYEISLMLDGVAVQPGGKVAVTLPKPANASSYASFRVVFVDDDGNVTPCETRVNADGSVTFITDHFSYYALVGIAAVDVPVAQPEGSMLWVFIAAGAVVVIAGVVVAVVLAKKKKKA